MHACKHVFILWCVCVMVIWLFWCLLYIFIHAACDPGVYTVSHKKTCHFTLDHNSHVSWWIFLHFLYQWKREWILYRGGTKFTTLPCVSTLPDKKQKYIKQHILKSIVTVFYYSTARMSPWPKWAIFYMLCSKRLPFALVHAVDVATDQ